MKVLIKKIILILIFLQALSAINYTFANVTEFSSVQISEIFPNPKGQDQGNEWIELYNQSENTINLKNWQIVESNKKMTLSDNLIINPKSYLILDKKNLKIALKNKNAHIELKDANNKTTDTVSYKKAEENQSFSKITVQKNKNKKTIWLWTRPTKNKPNPVFYELKGKILTGPEENLQNFQIETPDKKKLTILIPQKHKTAQTQTILKKDTILSLLVEKNNSSTYTLIDYKIQNNKLKNTKTSNPLKENWLYLSLIAAIIVLYWLLKEPLSRSSH